MESLLPGTRRLGFADQPAHDRFEAAILAKLGALDQGYRLDEHKDPDPAQAMEFSLDREEFWLVFFQHIRPMPSSGIFARVNQKTGEVEVQPE